MFEKGNGAESPTPKPNQREGVTGRKKLTCVKRGRKFDRGHIVGSDDRQGRMHNDLLCEICTEGPESWVEQRRRQCMACDRWFNPYRTQKEPFLCRRCVEESAGQFELPLNDAS
jgi:hypothetical protein